MSELPTDLVPKPLQKFLCVECIIEGTECTKEAVAIWRGQSLCKEHCLQVFRKSKEALRILGAL